MYLGIDIGGTKTLIALFSNSGRIIKKSRIKTPKSESSFLNTLMRALEPFHSKYSTKILSITVAIPGIVRNNSPVMFGNRPWIQPPISATIKNLFTCPIWFVNDANLGTLYESTFYSGRIIYLTFSTGIGGGIVENGQLTLRESNAFEPGHRFYDFYGEHLEWEDIASCEAIGDFYGTRATSVRGRQNYIDIANRISLGLRDIIHEKHPDIIIIGGPLALRFTHFIKPLRRQLKKDLKDLPLIVKANRPKESTIYGCYLYSLTKNPTPGASNGR